jgi:hypothetical protein
MPGDLSSLSPMNMAMNAASKFNKCRGNMITALVNMLMICRTNMMVAK